MSYRSILQNYLPRDIVSIIINYCPIYFKPSTKLIGESVSGGHDFDYIFIGKIFVGFISESGYIQIKVYCEYNPLKEVNFQIGDSHYFLNAKIIYVHKHFIVVETRSIVMNSGVLMKSINLILISLNTGEIISRDCHLVSIMSDFDDIVIDTSLYFHNSYVSYNRLYDRVKVNFVCDDAEYVSILC